MQSKGRMATISIGLCMLFLSSPISFASSVYAMGYHCILSQQDRSILRVLNSAEALNLSGNVNYSSEKRDQAQDWRNNHAVHI